MAERRVDRLDALTSLRFVAAAMIVVNHVRGYFGIPSIWGDPFPYQQGVTAFFVLSGFILTYVYPSLSWQATPRFWWARIARIWPAHVVGLLLFIALMAPRGMPASNTVQTGLANVLLVHAWIPIVDYFGSFNAPAWSVSTELGFYLLFPLLLVNFRRTWAWKLGLALVLLLVLGYVGNAIPRLPLLKANRIDVYGFVYVSPLGRLFEFVLGMCTCLLWQRIRTSSRLTTLWCTVGELAAVGLTILLLYTLGANGARWTAWLGDAGHIWLVHGGGGAPGFAAVILMVALGRGVLARLLRFPVLVILGEVSYSVYLVHQTLIKVAISDPWFVTLPTRIALPVFCAVTLALAFTIWLLVERPARRLLVGLVGGSATQPGATVTVPLHESLPEAEPQPAAASPSP